MTLGIGSTVWVFDVNRRVYRKDPETNRLVVGPSYREHWKELKITGETSRSWIVGDWQKIKVAKNLKRDDFAHACVCLSKEQLDRVVYMHDHCHKIAESVGRLQDADKLRAVAELIGYKET